MKQAAFLAFTAGCAAASSLIPGTRSAYIQSGGYDLQCPEGVRVEPALPDGWRAAGVVSGSFQAGTGEISYSTPAGDMTWCAYSQRVWDGQRAAIAAGREPGREVADVTRAKLIADERARLAREREQAAAQATFAADRAAYDKAEADAQAIQHATAEADAERRELAALDAQREAMAEKLEHVLLAQQGLVLLVSARVCALEADIAAERQELARARRVQAISGTTRPEDLHDSGEAIVDAEDRIAALKKKLRAVERAAAKPCSGRVREVAECMGPESKCSEIASAVASAWAEAQRRLDGANLSESEEQLRASMSPEQSRKVTLRVREVLDDRADSR